MVERTDSSALMKYEFVEKRTMRKRRKLSALCACIIVVFGMWMMLPLHCMAQETKAEEEIIIRVGSFEDTFNNID